MSTKKQIKRIVCTGGPCAGKSTFMSRAEEIFQERGYKVMIVHETATELITGGISPAPDNMGMYEFQKYAIGLQLKKEELYDKAADQIHANNVIIFYDRGILDDKGYVSPDEFTELLSQFNVTEEKARDKYDLVMHMVTAAKGAEEAYTLSNNAARYEGIEEAKLLDDTILKSWEGHSNRIIIENDCDFETKIRKAIQAVFTYLGEERPAEIFKKYLIQVDENLISHLNSINAFQTHIIQHYLKSQSGTERRIRKRERNGNTICYYSEAAMLSPSTRIKKDRIISNGQYGDYSLEIDPNLHVIDKVRYSFYYNSLFFKLDIFSFDPTKALLGIQVPDQDEEIQLPDFIEVIKDVSDIMNYKNYYLAKTQKF